VTITLRLAAAIHAARRHLRGVTRAERRPREFELPNYTVLVAMYREALVLPDLVAGLMALNYPPAKLDIKLVLEETDGETIAAAGALPLPPHFEILIVPDGAPRTKPRALNYALQFASGDFLTIYDAEDRPEPDQLMKAAAHFRRSGPEVACLQARLTFDNASENWLAKQFTIEYASLFGGILPMLDAARLPLPLGGTSNHFRVPALRRIGGWDPHNVTEDADLGMRLYRRGLRAEVLDSVTYEEACCQPWPWLKQRTRWLKGWIQTYGVHMREPFRLAREAGWKGFLAFQGHFAGVIVAALVHPLSYILILHDAARGILFADSGTFLGRHMLFLAIFNLVAGYAASLALGWFTLRGKQVRKLAPQLIFIPLYWLMISAACYRAVYQLIKAPYYWEKTEHGVSRSRRKPKVKGALARASLQMR
jgi:cellulose synthase/poly-beta-1,6-N-acetylglucosamine synthase-like glycosyltransferase